MKLTDISKLMLAAALAGVVGVAGCVSRKETKTTTYVPEAAAQPQQPPTIVYEQNPPAIIQEVQPPAAAANAPVTETYRESESSVTEDSGSTQSTTATHPRRHRRHKVVKPSDSNVSGDSYYEEHKSYEEDMVR